MKKILVVLLLFYPVQMLHAQENAESSRSISDLMYFPRAGTVFVGTSISYISTSGESNYDYGFAKLNYYELEGTSTDVDIGVAYGITDFLAVSISGSYTIDSTGEYTYGPASVNEGETEKYKSDGFSDPVISIDYRALEQKDSPIILDLFLSYSPKVIEREDASSTKKGNVGKGGHEFEGGLEIGRKFTRYSLSLSLSYEYGTKREYKDLSDNHEMEEEGGNDFTASLSFQYLFTEELYANLGIFYFLTSKEEYRDKESSWEGSTESYSSFGFGVDAGYEIIPEQFILGLGFYYLMMGDHEYTSGSDTFDQEDIEAYEIVVYSKMQF